MAFLERVCVVRGVLAGIERVCVAKGAACLERGVGVGRPCLAVAVLSGVSGFGFTVQGLEFVV